MYRLNKEQQAYIKTYAERHGKQWRFRMLRAWQNSEDENDPVLRQIRNLRINVYSIKLE